MSLGTLVGGQVALAVPLLVGAGLLLHTFLYLWNLNPGFDPNHVVTARFSMQDARYNTSAKVNQFYNRVIGNLRQIPGVESAAVALTLPYERQLNQGVRIPGVSDFKTTNSVYITPDYFATMRIPLLSGRPLRDTDSATAPQVGVVNEAFVNRYMKGQAVVGQSVRVGGAPVEIVGIVGDTQVRGSGWGNFGPVGRVPEIYVPAAQNSDEFIKVIHTWFSPSWVVRSSNRDTMSAVEQAIRAADPLQPPAEFRTLDDLKIGALQQQRFLAALVNVLGGLAILLTTLGIYGLIANLVGERKRELGIRLALGSTAGGAIRTALRPALIWVAGGIVAGSAAAFDLERFLKSFLYGVQPFDPITLALVGLGVLAATAVASFAPSLRVARLNPADTLRSE